MDETVTPEILSAVKNHLDITWDDPETNRKLAGIIAGGILYLDGKAGEGLDYTVPGPGQTLLFEYVRYVRDGALDVFEGNYQHMILSLQNDLFVARQEADT